MNRLIALALVALLTGCASYQKPAAMSEAQISPHKLAEAGRVTSAMESQAKILEDVAEGSSEVCTKKGPRLPFVLFINPQVKDPELRAAFLRAGQWTEQPKFISVAQSTRALDGKYLVRIGDEVIEAGEAGKAYWMAYGKAKDKKPIQLAFSDGTEATVHPTQGCIGLTILEPYAYKDPVNQGLNIEILPLAWTSSAVNRDELLFLFGRTLYFTSDEGADKLVNGLYAGSAINGAIAGITLGLSRFLIDTTVTVTNRVRMHYLQEADLFGFKAALRAGAEPAKILAYVKRMASQKNSDWDELNFDSMRINALEQLAVQPVETAKAF